MKEAVVSAAPSWWTSKGPVPDGQDNSSITANCFPKGFLFGTATSAFQVEGAAIRGGKGISVWDEFSINQPWKIADGNNGNVACDMYDRYKDDIKMMKEMGFNSYRFSIAWTRILPGGRCSSGMNQEGIDYYNDLINTVINHGMTPFVTLYHWDLPLCLEKEYGGFLSEQIKDDFREFAEVCFQQFGDRVKYWTTFNEPYHYVVDGYVGGGSPPGHKVPTPTDKPLLGSSPPSVVTEKGQVFITADSSEAYTAGRNMLLAHAEAVHLYRTMFQKAQGGKIGIVLDSQWFVPFDEKSHQDKVACRRALDFKLGWFLEPLLCAKYPQNMTNNVPRGNLKSFNDEERKKLAGSIDFLGLNYYTSKFASNDPNPTDQTEGYFFDQRVKFDSHRDGEPIGPPSEIGWLFSCPTGIYWLLRHLNDAYPGLKEIYITENGYATMNHPEKTWEMVCGDDAKRTKHHQDHLANLLKAMKDEYDINHLMTKVKGYFVWSWCDDYEWSSGYTVRFGLVYTDYVNYLKRHPKSAAEWFAKFLTSQKEPPSWFDPCWYVKPMLEGEINGLIKDNGEMNGTDKTQMLVET